MHEIREGFTHFWEILTGVFEDDKSKLIRLMSFVLLFLGMIWAGLNYFQAEKIADLDNDNYYDTPSSNQNDNTLAKLKEAAELVGTMRRGGEAIADSLNNMNTMPFNIAGYDELGLEDLNSPVAFSEINVIPDSAPASEHIQEQQDERKELLVKALMLAGKTKYAVIDYAQNEGTVIKLGQELPGGAGRVVRITSEGITVRYNGKEYIYTVK